MHTLFFKTRYYYSFKKFNFSNFLLIVCSLKLRLVYKYQIDVLMF